MKADSKGDETTGIANHLRKKCGKSPLYMSVSRGQSVLTPQTMGGNLAPHVFNQAKCDLKCVEYIIKNELPLRAVEGSGFREFIRELQPKFKIPNRKKISAGVWELFLMEKTKIMTVIGDHDQKVSITTDTWTSIQNINYMVVTAHFIDHDWVLHKRIINFTKITSHKGPDIGMLLESCLDNWGIENIFTITLDNASANDGAMDFMKRRLKARNTLMLEGEYLHLRCACHVFNLIVKDGLKELVGSIEGIRNCVKYIHSSPARLDKFRDFATLEKKDKMSTVPMDVLKRWNLTYKMLECALKFKSVFNRMIEYDKSFVDYFNEEENVKKSKRGATLQEKWVKRVGPPIETDWEKAQAFVFFLKKFYDATLRLSATKTTTSEIIFKEISMIQFEIEKKKNDMGDPILQSVASLMLLKLEKYWGSYEKINKLVFVANVLDPRYKLQRIAASFKALGKTPIEVNEICDGVKIILHDLYEYYRATSIDQQNFYDIQEDDCGDDDDVDDVDRQLMQLRRDEEAEKISNEVDNYLSDPFESLKNKKFKLLDWWKSSQSKYPILSKVAKDILAIPGSTVASENAFILGKRIVDPFRSSLTPKMVEALVCTSDWLRAEKFNFYKEPTEEELEFYKELEEMEANFVITQTSSTRCAAATGPRAS